MSISELSDESKYKFLHEGSVWLTVSFSKPGNFGGKPAFFREFDWLTRHAEKPKTNPKKSK
jgi:hypothetical protein